MASRNSEGGRGISPGLSIIHSNHLEDLRKVAVGWIKAHPLDVLETEQFIVQSNGMAQWLKLALADDQGCGISAGLEVQLPGRYVWTAYRSVLGGDIPENSPYDRERLVWQLFRLLPDLETNPVFSSLNRFLAQDQDNDQRRLSQLAAHLANLYDQYQVYRADWLEDWAAGRDRLARIGGPPLPLSGDQQWQAELWRLIRADIPEALRSISRSDLHQRFIERAGALGENRPHTLPPRVMVFGISSLPRQVLETLHAVSRFCQVLLFVQNPCRHFWADIIEDRELLRISHARHRSKKTMPDPLESDQVHQHANPLLAAWGKQGRDYIGLLYGYDVPESYKHEFAQIDLFEDFVQGPSAPLLHRVQQAVLDMEPLPCDLETRPVVDFHDRSISFTAAHSRQREVEILQDRLLSNFENIDGLQPGEIMVMTGDIEAYAPHIEAVFGNLPPDDPRFIPFTIADKPDRESIPLLKAIEKLLQLPDSRMGVSELVDLLEVPAFRERFGLGEEDLPMLCQWIRDAGVAWGLNSMQREGFGLPRGLDQNTWRFGLDRMLLGYAVGRGEAWNSIEPYDEVGGLDAALVGPLSLVIREMESLWQTLSRPASPEDWRVRIRTLVDRCFTAGTSRDRLTLNRLEEVLDNWLDACTQAELDQDLSLPVVREFILAQMTQAGISQRFLAGKVNFGTLMPMRAIPFRVVCLLGMNDGEFPRSHPPLDFDLMAGKGLYRPGDRSRREDDRYLFLEALLSARNRFYISYVGRDIRDNSERMPSVLVGQLRDYLEGGWQLEPGLGETSLLDHLTIAYPLQPFGREYFKGVHPHLFTYSHEWRGSLDSGKSEDSVQDPKDLDLPLFDRGLRLVDLVRFMKNPVKYFFNYRLLVRFDEISVAGKDLEPFALDGLAPFGLGSRLLEAGLTALPGDEENAVANAARRLIRTGDLPMAGFGGLAAEELARPVMDMVTRHRELLAKWPRACDPKEIALSLDSDDCLAASLDDWLDLVHETESQDGSAVSCARYGRWEFYPKPIMDKGGRVTRFNSLMGLWVRHVAAAAQGLDLESALVAPDGIATFASLSRDRGLELLLTMIRAWKQGMNRPLPVTAKTGLTYAHTLVIRDGEAAQQAAQSAYEGDGFRFAGEVSYDPCLQRVYPEFEDLWQVNDNQFISLSIALYAPLIDAVLNEEA